MPEVDTRLLLEGLEPALREFAQTVLEHADAADIPVYACGGPVRDLLLNRPIRDVDLLVESEHSEGLETVIEALEGQGVACTRHGRFGTFALQRGKASLDLAMARSETYARPGALPAIAPATLREDLHRRDFRVNALAVPLCGRGHPRRAAVLAVEGALSDLRAGRLEVLHTRSFHDDPTRALRAARLAARLGFRLSPRARTALTSAVRDGAFGGVSGDRLRREIEKTFSDSRLGLDPAAALRLLRDWHVLGALEPGLELPRTVITPIRRLGRTLQAPPWDLMRHRPWVAGLSLYLAEFPPPLRRRAIARFSISGATQTRIFDFRRLRDRLSARLARSRGRGSVDGELSGLAEEQVLALYAGAPISVRRKIVRWAREDRHRRTGLTGDDLRQIGLEGPAIGRVLARVRIAYLDGAVSSREDALTLSRELARRSRR